MQCVQQRAGNKVLWPDHARRPDEEAPREARDAEPGKLCRKHQS